MIRLHFLLNDDQHKPFVYRGVGYAQFAYPEDAFQFVDVVKSKRLRIDGRDLDATLSKREFDLPRILGSQTHSRSPRICMSGRQTIFYAQMTGGDLLQVLVEKTGVRSMAARDSGYF